MDDTTVAALEKWVRAGGTFIALHNTGQHSLLQANAWPISRLTGFRVTGWAPADEEITFEPGQRLWPSLESQRVGGSGQGQDWLGQNFAGGGIRLQATAAECQPVARWKDGSIAVGERALGRGRVIVLGSTFWRNARDLAGIYAPVNTQERPWLAELLAGLGVPELGQSGPWLREARSRTDGQPWLVVFNQTDAPMLGVTVNWEHGGSGVVRDLTAARAMRNLILPRTDYQVGPGPVRSFVPVAPAQTLVNLAGPGLPGMWPGPALTLHPAGPGSGGPYAEVSNWEKNVCFPGSFNLAPGSAAEQDYLVFSLRGNGRPVPLAVYLYDKQGGFREYCKAEGRALSLGGTGWVTARILLDPRGSDYASGSEQAAGGAPFHPEAVERITLAPIGNWRQALPDPAAIAALPMGLSSLTLERVKVDTTLTPTIYRRADGRLIFDLEPYQTRVFAAAP